MKITLCGSISFAREMLDMQKRLVNRGHIVYIPEGLEEYARGIHILFEVKERVERKLAHDFIRKHFTKIVKSDAILVMNITKKGIENYIGANAFLEIGYAYSQYKKIFLLNNPSKQEYIYDELMSMQPLSIDNDIANI